MLTRIRELAMQAATEYGRRSGRSLINNEVQELKLEVERIAQTTKYSVATS